MTKGKFRPATYDDILFFYEEPNSYSVRAWVYEVDDKPLGIGGVILKEQEYTAFLRLKNNDVFSKKDVIRGIKLGMLEINKMNIPLMAIRDKELESSEQLLEWCGFDFLANIGDNEVYIKCKQ